MWENENGCIKTLNAAKRMVYLMLNVLGPEYSIDPITAPASRYQHKLFRSMRNFTNTALILVKVSAYTKWENVNSFIAFVTLRAVESAKKYWQK